MKLSKLFYLSWWQKYAAVDTLMAHCHCPLELKTTSFKQLFLNGIRCDQWHSFQLLNVLSSDVYATDELNQQSRSKSLINKHFCDSGARFTTVATCKTRFAGHAWRYEETVGWSPWNESFRLETAFPRNHLGLLYLLYFYLVFINDSHRCLISPLTHSYNFPVFCIACASEEVIPITVRGKTQTNCL